MADRLELTIVGGFLGAGKTTWLRHQLHSGRFAEANLIVNEAAAESVDDLALASAAGMTVLSGGCACCDALDRLTHALRGLCDRRSAGQGPEEVVLETSGLADPAPIAAMIATDPVLARHMTVAEVIVLADCMEGPGRIAQEPLARAQISAADRVILTKTDDADPILLDRLRASIRVLAPGAEVTAAVLGVAVPLPAADLEAEPITLVAPDPDPLVAHVVDVSCADWPVLSVWLSALIHARGNQIMRIKGAVQSPAGPLLLQSVGAHMQPPVRLEDAAAQLVLIGRGTTQRALQASLDRWGGAG